MLYTLLHAVYCKNMASLIFWNFNYRWPKTCNEEKCLASLTILSYLILSLSKNAGILCKKKLLFTRFMDFEL